MLAGRARVASSVLAAHVDWAVRTLGPAATARMAGGLPLEARPHLAGAGDAWCPFWLLVATDRAIAEASGRADERVYHDLGRHSAIANWSAPYRQLDGHAPHEF